MNVILNEDGTSRINILLSYLMLVRFAKTSVVQNQSFDCCPLHCASVR